VEASLPLAFLGYGGFYVSLFVCFLLFGRISHLKLSSLGDWPSVRVVGMMFFGPFFHLVFLQILEARYAHPRPILTDTRQWGVNEPSSSEPVPSSSEPVPSSSSFIRARDHSSRARADLELIHHELEPSSSGNN
jgi:hypothetical protein